MQGGLVTRKVSVCLSVKRVDCDKTDGYDNCLRQFNLSLDVSFFLIHLTYAQWGYYWYSQ